MLLADLAERSVARGLSRLTYANPFLPDRADLERKALGSEWKPSPPWFAGPDLRLQNPNLVRLAERATALAERLHGRLAAGEAASAEDLSLYEDTALYALYSRYEDGFYELIRRGEKTTGRPGVGFWKEFAADSERFFSVRGFPRSALHEPAHVVATLFQVRRAFHHVFRAIVGRSAPSARLRAATWQSIFTHDLRRYRRALYDRMGDVTTLVSGPSGTGKELVARAIAFSRFVPFDPRTATFVENPAVSFQALHLAALSPTLVEAELFGHRRGAFTGALADRAGWLEVCSPLGTVFLDEIGEIDALLQVKLLRVLQTRTFQRIGESESREFAGKFIAATNRDLALEIREGRFREDFYYRLCADIIRTPSLAAQLADAPDDLGTLLLFIARRVAPESEATTLAAESEDWITSRLGRDYPWPGNVRELEQCVRNVLVRREYVPPPAVAATTVEDDLARAIGEGALTAEDLLGRYCAIVYRKTGSYLETARRLGLDRRTVKARVEGANRREASAWR